MEKRSYTNSYDHYGQMMDAHKSTGRLFGLISFDFSYTKFTMAVYMATPVFLLLLLSISLVWVGVIFVLYVIFSIEYNRVFDYREEVVTACTGTQLWFEAEIRDGLPQLPDAPDYIDQIDVDNIFDEALSVHKKPTFFRYARNLLVSS
jgi:hypothetical protein